MSFLITDDIEQGEEAAREWLRTVGCENIEGLNAVLSRTANPWVVI
ncbi:hypothetical protein OQG97_11110 [Streptococcus macedonicus]|nr:hypothetical protein [Streptococcus macedonicus]MCW8495434.1 hypothetical protein [Streptococcus macedonicus]MCW8500685.1 hypothetical protein [Streptococcus macedonicus]MCW8664434.1 hypothetical protein [Streptococcus macedonicus]MCW8674843.1 hypothetical protein [Streptococcus macedonicus]MCW8685037.1 hypothetical protein [Streptococcus macedonicus]